MRSLLSTAEIQERLASLSNWAICGNAIESVLTFPSFLQAIAFVNRVAQLAEEIDHHPEISIRMTQVHLKLTTHSCGGLSRQDFEMAKQIQSIAEHLVPTKRSEGP